MSSIGPNIIGSLFQAQVSARESAKKEDAQRNKRARDSEQLARLAEQQTHEVEDTEQTDPSRVHRQDERDAQDKDGLDAYEHLAAHNEQTPHQTVPHQGDPQTTLLQPDTPATPPTSTPAPTPDDPTSPTSPTSHIDLSA